MESYQSLLAQAKAQIAEVQPAEAEAELGSSIFLDVREPDEFVLGALPGAQNLPRGVIESRVGNFVSDPSARIVLYCAVGNRSALAAKTLEDFGFTNVVSMVGGFTQWQAEGRAYTSSSSFDDVQRERYQRHFTLPEVGVTGQQKLFDAKVLVVGAGGLGSPVAMYLAAAGVGTLGIVDMDVVDASNLQRQLLHTTDRLGQRKVASAKRTLTALNPDVEVVEQDVRLQADNVLDIIDGYDVIVDGTDNFPTRYLVNDAALLQRVPVVHGAIYRFEGQATVLQPYNGPCYRCIVPQPPPPELTPSCSEAGVLGVLPGIIGSIQALEALKLVLGIGETLAGRLLTYDALEQRFGEFKIPRDPACPACGTDAAPIVLAEYDEYCLPHPVVPETGVVS